MIIMDWGHGAKSGAVAGVFYGIVSGVIGMAYMFLMKEEVMARMQAALPSGVDIGIPMDTLYQISLMSAIPSGAIMGVIVGVIFGILFAATREELFGEKETIRGLSLAIIVFAGLGLAHMVFPNNIAGSIFLVNFTSLYVLPFSAAAMLLLGYMTGIFWVRFGEKHKK
jgi:hypothetical protein